MHEDWADARVEDAEGVGEERCGGYGGVGVVVVGGGGDGGDAGCEGGEAAWGELEALHALAGCGWRDSDGPEAWWTWVSSVGLGMDFVLTCLLGFQWPCYRSALQCVLDVCRI